MTLAYSRDQILALAPDASSVKAAQKLLHPGKWPLLAYDDKAVWGECQGSGKKPYLVQVDRGGPAFKCSCPSRKFPCKHGLALLLLLADSAGAFTSAEAPARVTEWLLTREARSQAQSAREETRDPQQTDAEAAREAEAKAARRAARQVDRRRVEMAAGLADFELWLQDLVRQGLAQLPGRDAAYWRQPATRLVDAKAPGMGRWLRRAESLAKQGREDWPRQVLATLGEAFLLCRAFRRFEQLPADAQADVRTALGWALDSSDVASEAPAREAMRVLGVSTTENQRLYEQRLWLQSEASGRMALVLSFAYGQPVFETLLSPGTVVDLQFDYYPSRAPLRVQLRGTPGSPRPLTELSGPRRLEAALDTVAEWLAANPWLDRLPLTLRGVRFLPASAANGASADGQVAAASGTWLLIDSEQRTLPVHAAFAHGWQLAALAGGEPIDLFGEWRSDSFLPLGALAGPSQAPGSSEGTGSMDGIASTDSRYVHFPLEEVQ